MHWLDYKINLPLPPTKLRWQIMAIILLAWGGIPNTEREWTTHLQCFVFPVIAALHIAGYWRSTSLWRCLLMVTTATVAAFLFRVASASLLRVAGVSIWDSFGSAGDFILMDWRGRGNFVALLAAQLFMALLSLVFFYFLARKVDTKTSLNP